MDIQNVLEKLCAPLGVSGYEAPELRAAEELLRPLVDETWIDRFGNLVGVRRCGKPDAKRLILDAHLDEVGLVVTGIEDGFLRFTTIGVDPRVLVDREVTLATEPPMFGVITCLPPHVQTPGSADKAAKREDLFIDVGLSQEEAVRRVPVGTPVSYRGPVFAMGDKICGKSLDDRSCFAALLVCAELLRGKDLDVDVYFLGSSREEVGGYGARTAAFTLKPDWAVAVDVTFAQSPDVSPSEVPCKLGGGPAIGVGPVIPRWMSGRLEEKAKAREIPYEKEILPGSTGTNGDDFETAREGIATALVSLPLRYMHTPLEVVSRKDVEQVGALLAAFTEDLGKEAGHVC